MEIGRLTIMITVCGLEEILAVLREVDAKEGFKILSQNHKVVTGDQEEFLPII